MIVICRRMGQLGNRLFLFGSLIAAAREYGVTLLNPCFAEYANLFPSTENDLWCRYDLHMGDQRCALKGRSEIRRRLPNDWSRSTLMRCVETSTRLLGWTRMTRPALVMRLRRDEFCDLEGERFRDAITTQRPLLLQGWAFRSPRLLEKHGDAVRSFFEPSSVDREAVRARIESARADADVLVGVHIRRGDYAGFMGGKFFYEMADYARWMHEIQEQLVGRRVAFLVCSNEPIDEGDFPGLRVVPGPGTVIRDLYALAETDWMTGPPSTFTGWASFIGKSPRYNIESRDAVIEVPSTEASRQAA